MAARSLIDYYANGKTREYYIGVARDVYALLNTGSASPPLPADVFQTLSEVLRRNDTFIQALLDKGVDVERSFLKWPGYFAAMVVYQDWGNIAQ